MTVSEGNVQQVHERETESCADGVNAMALESGSAPICPMAAMCRGTIEKPKSAYLLLIPGVLLMLIGVAIVVEPRILVWLVGGILVLLGLAVTLAARALHRTAARVQRQQRS